MGNLNLQVVISSTFSVLKINTLRIRDTSNCVVNSSFHLLLYIKTYQRHSIPSLSKCEVVRSIFRSTISVEIILV